MYFLSAIHSTKISGNFGPKLNGSVRSNRKSFEKTGLPFEVDLFSRSDRSDRMVEWIAPSFNRKVPRLLENSFTLCLFGSLEISPPINKDV